MAQRRTTTRRSGGGSRPAPQPRGARPPQPGLFAVCMRLIWWLILGLTFGGDWLLTQSGAPAPDDLIHQAYNAFLQWSQGPEAHRSLLAISWLYIALMTGEGISVLCLKYLQRWNMARAEVLVLRVRTPPNTNRIGSHESRTPDQDFFRAIAGAIPSTGHWFGGNSWVTFTLSRQPDQPVDLLIAIGSRKPQHRLRIKNALTNTVLGFFPDARVDSYPYKEMDDPFTQAVVPGRVVVWREWGLQLPSQYPLRQLDDTDGTNTDLLAPLLTALQPQGTTHLAEVWITIYPSSSWALNRGWRARATALKLSLEAKHDYALSNDGKLLEAKLQAAPFVTSVQALAVADTNESANSSLDAIHDSLGGYQARTGSRLQRLIELRRRTVRLPTSNRALRLLQVRAPRPLLPSATLFLPIKLWRAPDILSSVELGGLWHLPTPALGQLVRRLPCKILPAPPHAFVAGKEDRVAWGWARRSNGDRDLVGPTLFDMRQVAHGTAGMGAGKSRFGANFFLQCKDYGILLGDGKGDDAGNLAETCRRLLTLEDEDRLVLLDVLDAEWPVGMNPLAGVDLRKPGGVDQVYGQIEAVFARLDPETWGRAPRMKQFLRMSALLVLEGERYPTLAAVKQALIDKAYREKLLPYITNTEVRTFWEVTYPESGDAARPSLDGLLTRFDMILVPEMTRLLFNQPVPSFSFNEAIEKQWIVIMPIPHVTLGPLAHGVAMLLFQAFIRAAFERPGTALTRKSYPLEFDEFQILVENGDPKDVETALSQLRALGIPTLFLNQTLKQIQEVQDLMLINAQNRLFFQTLEPDASIYARQYPHSGLTAADISGQDPNEHQYAVLRCDGQPTGVFSMEPLPWPAPIEAPVPEYSGPAWQTTIPADSPFADYDQQILRLVYETDVDAVSPLALDLAQTLSEREWQKMLERWDAISEVQRNYIIENPGCIPERMERQRWKSRLLVARPRIIALIDYHRQRPAVAATETAAAKGGKSARNNQGAAPSVETEERKHWSTASNPTLAPILPTQIVEIAPEHRFMD